VTNSGTLRRTKRRWFLWLVGMPAVMLLTTASVLAVSLKRAQDRRLDAAIAAADRDNPNWRIADLLSHRAKVPDAENGAIVVAKVVKLLPEKWPGHNNVPPPGVPQPPDPPAPLAKRAYDHLTAAPAGVRLSDDLAMEVRLTLVENAEAVKLARTLVGYPRGRHEVTLGPAVIDTLLTETQNARTIARLLQMDAMLRAHDGDLDGALDSCRAILNTGRSIGDEPFLISMLVRVAIGQVALDTARRVLALGEPSDGAIVKLQTLIDDEAAQPLLTVALDGERGSMDEMIARLSTGKIHLADLVGDNSGLDPKRLMAFPGGWSKAWFDHQRAVELEWMTDAAIISRKPLHDQPGEWKRWEQRVVDRKKPWYGVYTDTIPLLLSPALSAGFNAYTRYQAMLRSTSLLLSAERHRRKTGTWPESADKIDPAFLARPPIDPYDGKLLRMKARDGQLFVYGVGLNRQDDGGRYNPKQEYNGGPVDVGTNAWDVALRGQVPPKDLSKPKP
jgi:hypothetical protein